MTQVVEYNREGYEGCKFDFLCNDKFLTTQKNSKLASDWFKDFTGYEPKTIKQVSKYPSREF